MNYPDGAEIPVGLPTTYRPASMWEPPLETPKTIGQRCGNCKHNINGYCDWYLAPVRDNYYCPEWAKIERKNKK